MAGIGHRGFMGRSASAFCPYLPGLYTEEEIDDLVFIDGYIPVYDAVEFDKIRTGASEVMGGCTKWGGNYTTGTDKKYIQINNIDFSGFGTYTSFSTQSAMVYDGNELNIYNVSVVDYGLFLATDAGSQIKNIRAAVNMDINTGTTGIRGCIINTHNGYAGNIIATVIQTESLSNSLSNVGAFVGSCAGTIEDCKILGDSYRGHNYHAGFAGRIDDGGIIRRCITKVNVVNTSTDMNTFVSGFVAISSGSWLIEDCGAENNVSTPGRISGGFFGRITTVGTIKNCYHKGSVSGGARTAGFIADAQVSASGTLVENCYCATILSGSTIRGFMNNNTVNAINCYFDADLAGTTLSSVGNSRTTPQMQEGTEDSYILPVGGVDGSSDPANLMYENWSSVIWDFGTDTEYPTLTTVP